MNRTSAVGRVSRETRVDLRLGEADSPGDGRVQREEQSSVDDG